MFSPPSKWRDKIKRYYQLFWHKTITNNQWFKRLIPLSFMVGIVGVIRHPGIRPRELYGAQIAAISNAYPFFHGGTWKIDFNFGEHISYFRNADTPFVTLVGVLQPLLAHRWRSMEIMKLPANNSISPTLLLVFTLGKYNLNFQIRLAGNVSEMMSGLIIY